MTPAFPSFFSSALFPTVESRTSGSNSSEPGNIVNTLSLSFTVTPAPTSGGSTGFVYVDYEDYNEYPSYDNPSAVAGARGALQTTTAAASTSFTTGHQEKTVLPHFITRKNTTPIHTAPFLGIPSRGHTTVQVKRSTVPDSPATMSVGPDDIKTATSSPNTSSRTQPQAQIKLWATEPTAEPTAEPTPSPPSVFGLPKKDNNSVDEVSYGIVGLDGDNSKAQQSYFVPQMPPVRERTQNKRIQQLLNEKRRQDVLRRTSRIRESRTGVRL